jgi:hypothetical protein
MIGARVPCCIPACRRSFKASQIPDADHGHDEIMCGRCYRTVEGALLARHKLIHRRWRKATKLLQRKAIASKPTIVAQYHRLDALFHSACARSWAAIKADAEFKSNMRIEGTAGELAARRKHAHSPRDRES